MSEFYDSIERGLQEAIAYAEGKDVGARVYKPFQVDVKAVRKRIEMTQEKFATTFGIGLGTLRHWERGDRKPKGAALVLLNMVAKNPHTVLSILNREIDLMVRMKTGT